MIIRGYSAGLEEQIKRPASCFNSSIAPSCDIQRAFSRGQKTLCFVASSCVYPVDGPQPYREPWLGTGKVEPTSKAHAYADLAIIAQCEAYSQQYGVNYFAAIQADEYGRNPKSTHFINQIMRRMHIAIANEDTELAIWGDGMAKREPLFYRDADRALQFLLEHYEGPQPINVGSGREYSISQVACAIQDVLGFRGTLVFDFAKPSGAQRKHLSNERLVARGFTGFTDLREGLAETYMSFKSIWA